MISDERVDLPATAVGGPLPGRPGRHDVGVVGEARGHRRGVALPPRALERQRRDELVGAVGTCAISSRMNPGSRLSFGLVPSRRDSRDRASSITRTTIVRYRSPPTSRPSSSK